MRKLQFLLTMALISAASAQGPFELQWEKTLIKGVNDIIFYDYIGDNLSEIFVFSQDSTRSMFTILDAKGELIDDIGIDRYQVHIYPSEEIMISTVADLDSDDSLDIIAGSEVHAVGINAHPLYRFEREEIRGKTYSKHKWTFKGIGPLTDILVIDFDKDGLKEIVLSSTDFNIYVLEADGSQNSRYDLGVSVWDIVPIPSKGKKIDLAAATFHGIKLLINDSVNWTYITNDRVLKISAADLDKDGQFELIGSTKKQVFAINMTESKLWEYAITDSTTKILPVDIENDGDTDLLFGSSNILYALNSDGSLKWEIPFEGRITSIGSQDLDMDSRIELLIGIGTKLYSYKLSESYAKTQDAENLYQVAIKLYEIRRYRDAVMRLEEARKTYLELDNMDKVAEIDALLEKYIADSQFQDKILQGDEYLNKSQQSYQNNDFENATIYAEQAKEIYIEVNYSYGSKECDTLLSRIGNKSLAVEYYDKAKKAYVESDFATALEYANKSKDIFLELGDTKNVLETEPIITLSLEKISNLPPESTILIPFPPIAYEENYNIYVIGIVVILLIVIAKVKLSKKKAV